MIPASVDRLRIIDDKHRISYRATLGVEEAIEQPFGRLERALGAVGIFKPERARPVEARAVDNRRGSRAA